MPRLRPGAAIILIMTRWHEDDLASRLLAEAAPQRGLECGYDREKPELANDINGGWRIKFRRRLPARRSATTRTNQKTRSRFPKWDPPHLISLPCELKGMVMELCPKCKANLALVGRMHRCVARELPRVEGAAGGDERSKFGWLRPLRRTLCR